MASEQDELRRGTLAAGERLPTLQQCALQREEYDHEEQGVAASGRDRVAVLGGVQHIGGLIDVVMARAFVSESPFARRPSVAKAQTQTVDVPVLDADAQKKFDEYLKQNKIASKGRRATDAAHVLRDAIVALMGDAMLARLPDGRCIQRVPQSREYPAKKKAIFKWDQLNEIPAEEE